MARLVSRAEFARLARVSKPAITKAFRGRLAPATQADRIDVDHPAARTYLASRGRHVDPAPAVSAGAPTHPQRTANSKRRAPTRGAAPGQKRPARPPAAGPSEPPQEAIEALEEYAALLRPLVERFGTGRNFRDWLLALKEIEIILEKHLGNEETQGRLIERDFVAGHVFGPIKSMFQKFLRDLPKTATRRLFALARSGGTLEEGEAVLRELISSQMKSVKTRVARALKEPTE